MSAPATVHVVYLKDGEEIRPIVAYRDVEAAHAHVDAMEKALGALDERLAGLLPRKVEYSYFPLLVYEDFQSRIDS